MRRFLAAGVLLAGMVCGWAQAGIVYTWEAECRRVEIRSETAPWQDLACTQAYGTIEMVDGYVPGTQYRATPGIDDPHPKFSIFTDIGVGFRDMSMIEWLNITLPVMSGPGSVWWNQNAIALRQYDDWVFAIESPYPGGTLIYMGDLTFERVPEPGSLALLAAGLLGVVGVRRRS